MKYRSEIDGLRALAVVPVILFHAGLGIFSGGFVGVDVFFVISGYLITTILIEDIENNRFSILGFYERRARRILPALFVVVAACLPFAWLWMFPNQMKDFSQSLIAVSLFASNVLFWKESGYFNPASEEKPLLHTWSLAVEEQYYVIFPIFLFLAWRFGKNRVFWMIVVMACLSLMMSEWGWRNKATANFYLAPTRAWELFAGSIAAFIVQKRGVQKNDILAMAGLFAVVFSIFFYDETTPFPSIYALVPILGVVFIVLFADTGTLAAKILSLRVFVGIGLISYSAYLWHQPLFAFARLRGLHDQTVMMALALASVALAYITWRFVEAPFRNRALISRGQIFAISIVGLVAMALFGVFGIKSDGFKGRMSEEQKEFLSYFNNELPEWQYFERLGIPEKFWTACDFYDLDAFKASNETKTPRTAIAPECTADTGDLPEVFIWGDSHAQQYTHGFKTVLGGSFAIRQIAASGCPPDIVLEKSTVDYCARSNYEALRHIQQSPPEIVVLAESKDHDIAKYDRLIDAITEAGGSQVIIMGPAPIWTIELPQIMTRHLVDPPRRFADFRNAEVLATNEALRSQFAAGDRALFVDVIGVFCDETGCLTHFGDNLREGITSWDYGHLTPVASEFLAKEVEATFSAALEGK